MFYDLTADDLHFTFVGLLTNGHCLGICSVYLTFVFPNTFFIDIDRGALITYLTTPYDTVPI